MKILLVSDYGVPRGGSEIVTLAMRRCLREHGHDARLFASSANLKGGPTDADYHCFGTMSPLRAALWPINPFAAVKLARVLNEFQPHVVHVRLFLSQLSPLILPLLRNVPAILHEGWYRTVCPIGSKVLPDGRECNKPAGLVCCRSGCVPPLAWPLAMAQLRLWQRWRDVFDLIIANSQAVARQLREANIGPVEVIRNGIAQREARPPLTGPPTIVFAGRLVREKGVDVLLRAFELVTRRLAHARLMIAGEGPEKRHLEKSSEHLVPNVTFLGHLPRAEIERRFNAAWVQAVPSRGAEAFGNAGAEAMMRGTALVATANGGFTEYVQHQRTGLLVPSDDAASLSDALLSILSDREFAESLGQEGRRFALQEFNQQQFIERFEAIYSRLTAHSRS